MGTRRWSPAPHGPAGRGWQHTGLYFLQPAGQGGVFKAPRELSRDLASPLSLPAISATALPTGFVQLVTPTKRVCVQGLGVLDSLCLRSPARPVATSSSFDPSSPESKETRPRPNPPDHPPLCPSAPLNLLPLCPHVPFPNCKLLAGRDVLLGIPRARTVCGTR